MVDGVKEFSRASLFYEVITLIHEGSLLKTLPPNTIMLGIKISTY